MTVAASPPVAPGNNRTIEARQRLLETYRNAPAVGLVLGAGVSVQSGVPDYATLATRVLELAVEHGDLDGSTREHRRLLAGRIAPCEMPPPDEILSYARAHIVSSDRFLWLVREALYRDVAVPVRKQHEQQWRVDERTWTTHRTIAHRVFTANPTLDAVISFCAAEPHAGPARSSTTRARVATNRHVGAILTTNYDNLVEASFGTKYLKSLLKPVGRFPLDVDADATPVFHCHGYVTYPKPKKDGDPAYSPLLIAEEDYYSETYDAHGFGNTVIARVLQQMPCLFIGSAMTDRNLRRHLLLAHDAGRSDGATPHHEHFAILPENGDLDHFADAVLARYRVSVIRIRAYSEIPELLRSLYLAADDTTEDDWNWTQMSFGKRDEVRRAHLTAAAAV